MIALTEGQQARVEVFVEELNNRPNELGVTTEDVVEAMVICLCEMPPQNIPVNMLTSIMVHQAVSIREARKRLSNGTV